MFYCLQRQRLLNMSFLLTRTTLSSGTLYKAAFTGTKLITPQKRYVTSEPKFREDEWVTIYKFPYILKAAQLSRLKNFYFCLTAATVPVVYWFEYFAMIPQGWSEFCMAIGFTGCTTFTLVGLAFRNLVGFAYFDEVTRNVRLGYLTFWGRREDIVVPVESIKPFSEIAKLQYNPVSSIQFYDSELKFKILEWIGVVRRDLFEEAFGKS